jgi:hypothetical protein
LSSFFKGYLCWGSRQRCRVSIVIKRPLHSSNMVSCRICGKDLDNEIPADHMSDHDKRGEIPHIRNRSVEYNKRD